jgi:hypothetical protein
MISQVNFLQQQFSALLRWEQRKRHERSLLILTCYALLAALFTLPLAEILQPWGNAWFGPALFFVLLAPWVFWYERRTSGAPARTISRLDKTLGLEERALTAWEIVRRNEIAPAEELVLKQASEKLRNLIPETLFPRKLSWQAYAIVPLFVFWCGLLWFGIGIQSERYQQPSRTQSAAQKLRAFARQLQETAKAEGLRESLNVGRELQQLADKRLEGATGEKGFHDEIATAAKKIDSVTRASSTEAAHKAETHQALKDLRTELEVAKDSFNFPSGTAGERETGAELNERLAGLPNLRRALEQGFPSRARPGGEELKSFLDKMEREVTRELDRRSLIETQQFLEQMASAGKKQTGENQTASLGREEREASGEGPKEKGKSSFPGTEPGRKEGDLEPSSQLPPGAAAHLKGLLREGTSAGIDLKGKPSTGKPTLGQDDVVASYRRQAEAELNTERLPEALKETIKKYFLSLEEGK